MGYPIPKHQGGFLIRRVINFLRMHNVDLPLKKVILTNSGGSDSMALCHLFIKYGRKLVLPENISILHVNHGWRGKESDEDENFVHEYAKRMEVPIHIFKLTKPTKEQSKRRSLEDLARIERKRIFSEVSCKDTVILTAHHSDDLAETLLWRLCSGKMESHSKGILVKSGNEIRPFLSSTKEELKMFLKEENLNWREDHTNHDGNLLRSKIRQKVMPNLIEVFPLAVKNIREYALKQQLKLSNADEDSED